MPDRERDPARGEFGAFGRENRIEYTRKWEGERFDDGRPRVPDDIVERMGPVSITQAWGVLRGDGYNFQCEDGWQCTHPGKTLVGRAVRICESFSKSRAQLGDTSATRSRGPSYAGGR